MEWDSIRSDMGRLPWRGPVVPDLAGVEEHLRPTKRGVHRVKQFDMKDPEHVQQYEAVLNRKEQGLAEIVMSQHSVDQDGNFRLLCAWKEFYMSSPSFKPEEGEPHILTHTGGALLVRGEDEDKAEGLGSLQKAVEDMDREREQRAKAAEVQARQVAEDETPEQKRSVRLPNFVPEDGFFSINTEQDPEEGPPETPSPEPQETDNDVQRKD